MRKEAALKGRGVLCGLVACLLRATAHPAATDASSTRQGKVLANITAQVVRCEAHPCLGDTVKRVRDALHDAIVTDDTFYYSDLTVAYPSVRGDLQGLVEWDLDDGLEAISMKITDFHAAPPEVIAEIEQALPACHMEGDGDGEGTVGEARAAMGWKLSSTSLPGW